MKLASVDTLYQSPGKKSLMEKDGGKSDGGIRFLEEAGVLVEKSDVGSVNTGIKPNQPQINLVVDLETIGESTSANAEGNGLCWYPDVVTNDRVPDENSEIEALNIAKVNVYNDELTYVEDPWGGTTLNGTHDIVTNELVQGGKLEIGVNTAEGDVGTDNRTKIEGSGCVTILNGKQHFLTDDIMQAGKSVMEVIKNCKADVVTTERNGGFCISDLVWGKVKGYPWWPGQIFAPSAASDKAIKYFKKDNYLITYFGYQNFSWKDVSKIKPFRVNFTEMVKQSNAKAFSYAVNCAVDEVSRRVEVGLSCPCLPVDVLDQIKTQVIANTGVREESSRREGHDNSFTAASFLARETLQLVESFAVMPNFITDRLKFAISKAQILAFDRWRGVYQPSVFEHCGFLVDDDTHFTREVDGIDPKEVNGGVPAASDIVSEIPSRKRNHVSEESIVSGSKEKRKHSQLSLKAIDGVDTQPEKNPRVRTHISKTFEMIQLFTPTPNETVEKLNSFMKTPLQEHDDTMMQAPNFLRAYGQTGHEAENKGKSAVDIFGFKSIEDSYLSHRVIQSITPTRDKTLGELDLAAKMPMEEHDDTMARAVNFLNKYKNSICLDERSFVQTV